MLCKTLNDAKAVYELLDDYLQDRGLTLAHDKTKITNLYDGFDFVGYNIRCYRGQDCDKVLIKASKDSIKSFKSKAKISFVIVILGTLKKVLFDLII